MAGDAGIDMVAWDFGDTLCDEQLMRVGPPGVEGWREAINEVWAIDGWVDRWSLGEVAMGELVVPLAERLPMSPAEVSRHLRATWRSIDWFERPCRWIERLDGAVLQAIVTVNPHEFQAIAAIGNLDRHVDIVVTSADVRDESKVVQARAARRWLGLDEDLSTTLLIDNKAENTAEFIAAGGHAHTYDRDDDALDACLEWLLGSE